MQLKHNPELLAQVQLYSKRHTHLYELSFLLEELKNSSSVASAPAPEGHPMLRSPIPPSGRNPVYTFIQRNLSDPVSILSQWANDKLVSKDETLSLSSSYCSDYTYPSVPTDAGVYV